MTDHHPTPSGPTVSLRALLPGVYLPTLLFEIGVGAMMPMIAVSTTALGGSLATAAVMVSLLAVGKILADVPAGALAAKVGDRPAMVGASGLAVLALVMLALAPNLMIGRPPIHSRAAHCWHMGCKGRRD